MTVVSTTSTSRPLWALAGLTVSGALALSACAPDEPAEFDDTETESTSETEETETPEAAEEENNDDETSEGEPAATEPPDVEGEEDGDEEEATEEGSEAGASPAGLNHDDAIETIAYEVPGDSSVTLEFGFHELRVIDDVVLLEMSIVPEHFDSSPSTIVALNDFEVISPELTDRENLKQYSLVAGGEVTSSGGPRWESGQTASFWGYYAAPQDDIDTITVSVIPGSVEFEDMDITWDGEESASSGTDESVNSEEGE